MKLVEIILDEMNPASKSQKKFFTILTRTITSMYGRTNFRSLSRYSGLSEKTFRRWFKKAFDFVDFNARLIAKTVTEESVFIAAFDPSFLSKAGKKTWGKDSFWNGSASKAEKGLELALCSMVDVTRNTGYAIAAEQTPTTSEIRKLLGVNEAEEVTRIDFYLSFIKKVCEQILKRTRYLVADCFFAKKKFVDGIIALGFHFICKLRADANLKILYTGKQRVGRGRPKKYAGKCNINELQGFAFEQDVNDEIKLYSGIFYHASFEREIKVVALVCTKGGKVGTALLFSTNLFLDAFKIFQYYKARFQIEFIFRDAKQYTGLGDCQARDKASLHYHFNASLTALNVAKIQAQLARKDNEKRDPFSMASHKARGYNEMLIGRFFSMLGSEQTLIKLNPVYNEVLNYGTISSMSG